MPSQIFLQRNGSQLERFGKRVRGFMFNWYGLIQENYTTAQLDTYFSRLADLGVIGVRTWAFNKSGTPSNTAGYFRYRSGSTLPFVEATYVSLDRVLDSARRHGIVVFLVLSDNWTEFSSTGHKQTYTAWSNAIHGTAYDAFNKGDDFYLDANIIQWKKDEIDKLYNRTNTVDGITYPSHPGIGALEMINEGRFTTGEEQNYGQLTSYFYTTVKTWMNTMSTYAAGKFPNHLIGTGSQAQFIDYYENDPVHNNSTYGNDYTDIHKLTNIHFYDFHMYPLEDATDYRLKAYEQKILSNINAGRTRRGFLAQINEYVSVAKANNKPVIIGELGIDKRANVATVFPTYPRVDFFRDFANYFFSIGGDIINIWHGTTSIFDDNNYNVLVSGTHTGGNANSNDNDNDASLLQLIADITSSFNRKRNQKTPTKITPTLVSSARSQITRTQL